MTDEVKRPAILGLVPTSCGLLVNVDKGDDEQIVLLGEVKLKRGESVNLSNEDFEKLEGKIRIVDARTDLLNDDKPIGRLTYFKEIASYELDVKIPTRRFDALLTTVTQGRLPSEISITVAGMTYDWQPDGSGKKWDNKKRPDLPITSITIYTALIGGDPRDFFDARTIEETLPPTRAQLKVLLEAINYVAGRSRETAIFLFIILGLLLVVVWRGW
jgi:hypothetical protein